MQVVITAVFVSLKAQANMVTHILQVVISSVLFRLTAKASSSVAK